jgi:isopenicillin-N N-acyltransferase like protein
MQETSLPKRFEVLEVRGSPHERGYQYGAHNKAKIKGVLDAHYRKFATKEPRFSKEQLLNQASKYEPFVLNFSERVSQEVHGIAEGAEVDPLEIYLVGAEGEIFNALRAEYPARNCTSFAATGAATTDHLTYVGQDNDEPDDPWLAGECVTLTRHIQTDAPNVLIYTYAGVPAMMGINSSGLCLCLNAIKQGAPKMGVPIQWVQREVLNQRTLEDAIKVVQNANRAGGMNMMLGSKEGIADLEVNAHEVKMWRSDKTLYHANHYLEPNDFAADDPSSNYYSNSSLRCIRMKDLIAQKEGSLNLETFEGMLADHGNEPNTICRHLDDSPGGYARTFDAMIFIAEKGEAWIARDNPCTSPFVKYQV